MSEIISKPIVPNLKSEILIMVKNEFLKLNNLKIGDSIIWNFRYDTLRSQYKGGMASYGANEESEGILKENKDVKVEISSHTDASRNVAMATSILKRKGLEYSKEAHDEMSKKYNNRLSL